MKLAGFQRLTLLDFPGVVACTVFTVGCNFQCPFCHNASLARGNSPDAIDTQEVLRFLKKRQGVLEGVVVTGGEPLLQHDIAAFLKEVKALGYAVKLDTNGTNPELLAALVSESLVDYVAMDIKHAPEKYALAAGRTEPLMDAIARSKELLLGDAVDYEFRTTVVKGIHTREDLVALAQWITGAKRYYLQQFQLSADILSPEGLSEFDKDEMTAMQKAVAPYVEQVFLRGL